ncbi:MAG: MMPL family transporter [Bacteroidota bacterium]
MSVAHSLTALSTQRPRWVFAGVLLLTLGLGALIPRLQIDTDPENMLPEDQPARVFHRAVKADFALYDFLVVGVVNEAHPSGVFNAETLTRVHALTRGIEAIDGVVAHEVLSLATVDDVRSDGEGVVRFDWMMDEPPSTDTEALAIQAAVQRQPVFLGTLVSEDRQAAAIYVPIVDKSESHRVAEEIRTLVASSSGDEAVHITGLPVAEETFGVEMFVQMGVAAPMAGLMVFFMLWFFFRSFALITSPMLVALATVIATMGLLIGLGFPVHIMSSMIPIFLMPIAVVDSVHILSEFADRYSTSGDRQQALAEVMEELFTPMLYTSLTSAVGFASLAFAPIPPVRVFGLFVAFGILLAFALTILFVPAYITVMSEAQLAKMSRAAARSLERGSFLSTGLLRLGDRAVRFSKAVVVAAVALVAFSAWGVAQITINDNPVRWFRASHEIRVADRVLNQHFGGTYDAYLVLRHDGEASPTALIDEAEAVVESAGNPVLTAQWADLRADADGDLDALLDGVYDALDFADMGEADTDEVLAVWEDVLAVLEGGGSGGTFRDPATLSYVEALQATLLATDHVGKSNALPDLVKTVHRALRDGDEAYFSLPETSGGVAQTLLSYQSSHRPNDLWHFVTPDYDAATIWVQLKSGDNQDMLAVTEQVAAFIAANPPPGGVTVDWAGLTYLNVVWQEAMVNGMLNALLGSFAIVFVMMFVLFRSLWVALLAMLPLSVTILFIYGLIGWVGKDYDMPIAVLSSLTLGLSIDFAIHFLQRSRVLLAELGDWPAAMQALFAEPARAITRNALVIAIGFLPLLVSPLVPYNTVGVFLATIMAASCLATLLLLPAAMGTARSLRGRRSGSMAPASPTSP